MFCGECGKEIPEDSKFCPQCGKMRNSSLLGAGRGVMPEPVQSAHEHNVGGMISAIVMLIALLHFPYFDYYYTISAMEIDNMEIIVILLLVTIGCFFASAERASIAWALITYLVYFVIVIGSLEDRSVPEFGVGAYTVAISGLCMVVFAFRGAGIR